MNPRDLLAVAALVAIGLLPFIGVVRFWRTTSYSATQLLLFAFAYSLVRFRWRSRLPLHPPAPPGRGAVLIANHRSSIDPFFVQMTLRRPSHWMVAREYFQHPVFGWFLRHCEAIPAGRGGVDTAAIKTAIRLAADGELVGLFPEGRINLSPDFMLPVRPGAILVALRARVPIIPCYIDGAPFGGAEWSPIVMAAKARVRYGRPIDLSDYYDREQHEGAMGELMRRCVREIALLAGRPDFEPKLAGRRWLNASRTDAADLGDEPPGEGAAG